MSSNIQYYDENLNLDWRIDRFDKILLFSINFIDIRMLMEVKEAIKLIEQDGWYLKVTIAGKMSDDLHPKTLKSIFKQAQINL